MLLPRSCNVDGTEGDAGLSRVRGNPPLHGAFDHGWHRWSASRSLCGSKKKQSSVEQRSDFGRLVKQITIVAQPPYTRLADCQSLSSPQLPPHTEFCKPSVILSVVFTSIGYLHRMGQFFGLPTTCEKAPTALVTELCEHFRWRGDRVPFVGGTDGLEFTCRMKLATALALSQVEADESLSILAGTSGDC